MSSPHPISALVARLRCMLGNHVPHRGRVTRDRSILFGHCTRCGKAITKVKGDPRWRVHHPDRRIS